MYTHQTTHNALNLSNALNYEVNGSLSELLIEPGASVKVS